MTKRARLLSIDPALLSALKEGHRHVALLQALEPHQCELLLKTHRTGVRKKASKRKTLVRQKLLTHAGRFHPSEILRVWGMDIENQLSAPEGLEIAPSWEGALFFRYVSALFELTPPQPMREMADEVIAARKPALYPEQSRVLGRWLFSSLLEARLEGLQAFALEQSEALLGHAAPGHEALLEYGAWLEAQRARYDALLTRLGEQAEAIKRLIERYTPSLLEALEADPQRLYQAEFQGQVAVAAQAERAAAVAGCEHVRDKLLATLPGRLLPAAPARDARLLEEEAAALRATLKAGDWPDLVCVAPTLDALGAVLLDGRAVDEAWGALSEGLSWRLCEALRSEEVTLAPLDEAENPAALPALVEVISSAPEFEPELEAPEAPEPEPEPALEASEAAEPEAPEVPEPEPPEPEAALEIPAEPISEAPRAEEPTPRPQSAPPAEPAAEPQAIEAGEAEAPEVEAPEAGEDDDEGEDEDEGDLPEGEARPPDATPPPPPLDDATPEEWARRLLKDEEPDEGGLLLACLQRREEGGLEQAYWWSKARGEACLIQPWLVEFFQLGVQFHPSFSRSERRLRELLSEALIELQDMADAMMASAALIRPALMAPATTHPQMALEQVSEALSELPEHHGFIQPIIEFALRCVPISPILLGGMASDEDWIARRRKLEEETEIWLENAPLRNINYQTATFVWQSWTKEGGLLRGLIQQAAEHPEADLEAEIAALRDDGNFQKELDRFSQARRRRIHGQARSTLRRYLNEALDMAERWRRIHEQDPNRAGQAAPFGQSQLLALSELGAPLLEALEPYIESDDPRLSFAAEALAIAVGEIVERFEVGFTPPEDPHDTRVGWARLMPDLSDPEAADGEALRRAVLERLAEPLSVEQAVLAHLKRGHLEQAKRLAEGLDDEDEALNDEIEASARDWRKTVQRKLQKTKDEIEGARLKGGLTDHERDRCWAEVETLSRAHAERPDRPYEILTGVAALEGKVAYLVHTHTLKLGTRFLNLMDDFEAQEIEIDEALRDAFRAALDAGEISVVDEMLVACKRALNAGRPPEEEVLPLSRPAEQIDHLQGFIDDHHAFYERARDLRNLQRTLSSARQAEAAGAWVKLRQEKQAGFQEEALFTVLRFFGFDIEEGAELSLLASNRPPFWLYAQLQATLDAPIPRFGSQARSHGGHHFVLIWGPLRPLQLTQWLDNHERVLKDQPLTLLLFKRLSLLDRRHLVDALRDKGYGALLIDDCVIPWLMDQRRSVQVEALIQVALAGASENPYTPEKAGSVPDEMFFGRRRTLESLWRRDGACVLYGGRQLGKSALLRQLRLEHHRPERGHWVLTAGVSNDEDIWAVIHRLLRAEGILDGSQILNPRRQKEDIEAFLAQDLSRRILLLLDESDHLLDADQQDRFRGLHLVRDLMTETDRRFKVVFAGLHGVQRFQQIPNQPLAHFGEPICVGPLHPKAAANLVEIPLRALGYRFEAPHLIHRILAQTNCHPSLLQLFCHSLVEEMHKSARYNRDRILPLMIDEEVIARVDREVELGKRMRLRFDWTLNLDPRYRAIGYTLAWLELNQEFEGDKRDGLDLQTMLAEVQQWWPQGFARVAQAELMGLMTEMEGLGLIITTHGRYRLRSPNLLRLLGGVERVAAELEQLEALEADETPYPQVYHRADRARLGWASPLTWHQEQRLSRNHRGLDLIIGSPATQLGEVIPALLSLYAGQTILDWTPQLIVNLPEGQTLVDRAREIYEEHHIQFALSIIFPDLGALGPVGEGLESLIAWLEGLDSERRFVRLVCLIDPAALDGLDLGALRAHDGVEIHDLSLWRPKGLRHWFSDVEIPGPNLDQLLEVTGGWPSLVADALRAAVEGRLEEPIEVSPARRATLLASSGALDGDRAALFEALCRWREERGTPFAERADIFEWLKEGPARPERALDELLALNLVTQTPEGIAADPILFEAWRSR